MSAVASAMWCSACLNCSASCSRSIGAHDTTNGARGASSAPAFLVLREKAPGCRRTNGSRVVGRLGAAAKMPFPIHPHMLRHACGSKLANQGVDTRSLQHYLGHKHPAHRALYRAVAGTVQGFLEGLKARSMPVCGSSKRRPSERRSAGVPASLLLRARREWQCSCAAE